MQLVQTLSQRQQMGGQMLQSLAILGMSPEELEAHLKEQAASNPCISYRPPRMTVGGAAFDAVAVLAAGKPSLIAHVTEQIDIAFPDPEERIIALRFAEALEPTGWLGQPLAVLAGELGISGGRAEDILARLQELEPVGIFARSLSECLALQAGEGEALSWGARMLIDHLDLLSGGRGEELAALCDCEPEDIPDLARELRRFDPKPGLAFASDTTPIFPPELIVTKRGRGWQVERVRGNAPSIDIHPERLPEETEDRDARSFRRRALTEAKALLQALERRSDTLLRTAAVLVEKQSSYVENGARFLLPLSLEDVAEEVGVHASTISRAVSGRLIQTPRGTLPLRSFFCRSLGSGERQAITRDSAVDFVRRIVAGEDRYNPLSDGEIVALAGKAGVPIARRTVAKYRSILGIAPSFQRRAPVAGETERSR